MVKDILKRLRRLEERHAPEDMEILICVEKGKRIEVCVTKHEATMMALKQSSAQMFGTKMPERLIVDVETDPDDGFIKALIECNVTAEDMALVVEV